MNIIKYLFIFLSLFLVYPCVYSAKYVQSYTSGNGGTTYSEAIYYTDLDREAELKEKEEELKIKDKELKEKEEAIKDSLYNSYTSPYIRRVIYQPLYSSIGGYNYHSQGFHYGTTGGLTINYNSKPTLHYNDGVQPPQQPRRPHRSQPPQQQTDKHPHHPSHPNHDNRQNIGNTKDYEPFVKKID